MAEEKCKVHGTILKPMKVPVSYGLPLFDNELIEARDKLFPNSRRSVLGGCSVGAFGDRAIVLVCDKCRKAETAWNEANQPYRNRKTGKI